MVIGATQGFTHRFVLVHRVKIFAFSLIVPVFFKPSLSKQPVAMAAQVFPLLLRPWTGVAAEAGTLAANSL